VPGFRRGGGYSAWALASTVTAICGTAPLAKQAFGEAADFDKLERAQLKGDGPGRAALGACAGKHTTAGRGGCFERQRAGQGRTATRARCGATSHRRRFRPEGRRQRRPSSTTLTGSLNSENSEKPGLVFRRHAVHAVDHVGIPQGGARDRRRGEHRELDAAIGSFCSVSTVSSPITIIVRTVDEPATGRL
jgi:hypothetical protein